MARTNVDSPDERQPLIQNNALYRAVGAIHPVRHHKVSIFLNAVGHWSSVIFTGFILLIPWIPAVLFLLHKWIGLVYFALQLMEIAARRPIQYTEWMKDHFLSLVPALAALILIALGVFTRAFVLTAEGWDELWYFTAISWLDFIAGLFIFFRILEQPFERNEFENQ